VADVLGIFHRHGCPLAAEIGGVEPWSSGPQLVLDEG
jgi:hypothetical protein